jgi:hypothetical protein
MDSDSQLPVNEFVTLHLRIKGPFDERGDPGSRQLSMFARFQDDDRHFGILR